MATGRTVKDVSPHEFVKAYAAHLKRSGKVSLSLTHAVLLELRFCRSQCDFSFFFFNSYLIVTHRDSWS